MPTIRKLVPRALSEESWAPFGWIPLPDTDPRDGEHRLEFAWADAHVNVIGHTLDELEEVGGALRCPEMYRHLTHTQTLMPLDHSAVIAVAPADDPLESPADAERIEAFVLRPLDSIVLDRGTWHWGPYPLGARAVRLFNVQGFRYAEDNDRADLGARGLTFDVATDALPAWQASRSGVIPVSVATFGFAPASRSIFVVAASPWSAAQCSAVLPSG